MESHLRSSNIDNPGASANAIEHHYDVSNAFFATWLDTGLTYSCAMRQDATDLEAAQQAKLDYHLEKCGASSGHDLLDVGCGWGATLARAVSAHGVKRAVGLTLSRNQAIYVADRYPALVASKSIEARVENWIDHEPLQPYDAIVSLGAFEHFARPGIGRAAKVEGYRAFFERCRCWLKPGGRLALQTIVWDRASIETGSKFIMEEIYPETDVPEVSEIFDAAKGVLEIRHLVSDREAYVWTLTEWRRRLRARRAEAQALVGDKTVERYERYLSLCAVAFHTGNLNLLRLSFSRD